MLLTSSGKQTVSKMFARPSPPKKEKKLKEEAQNNA